MKVRKEVFISSTYIDLVTERAAIRDSVIKLGFFPSGMESFPAADISQFDHIKTEIDSSDFYILVIGGRYGSVDNDGISFTEKEYDYAVETSKHILAFIHAEPLKLPAENYELNHTKWEKLEQFKAKVSHNRLISKWNTAADLSNAVMASLINAEKRTISPPPEHPTSPVWTDADEVLNTPDIDVTVQIETSPNLSSTDISEFVLTTELANKYFDEWTNEPPVIATEPEKAPSLKPPIFNISDSEFLHEELARSHFERMPSRDVPIKNTAPTRLIRPVSNIQNMYIDTTKRLLVGADDLCPCGSGRAYSLCHGLFRSKL